MPVTTNGQHSFPVGKPELLFDICTDTVATLMRLYREYGLTVSYPHGTQEVVFAFGPEANREVFSDTDLYHNYGLPGPKRSSQRSFQYGLFGLNGAKHLEHRRLLKSAFHKDQVFRVREAVADQVESHLGAWRFGQTLDLYESMSDLSLKIACRLLFGLPEDATPDSLSTAFRWWLSSYIALFFETVLPVDRSEDRYEGTMASAEQVEGILRKLVAIRKETLRDDDFDVMAVLLRAHQAGQLSEIEIIGEMHTLLNAAYQTTASALTWTLLLLGQHPEIHQRLYDEVRDEPGYRPKPNDLLDRVIKESLRLCSPAVFSVRRLVRDAELLGRPLAVDSLVILSFHVSHHLVEVFPEPEKFDPDRWLTQQTSPWEYLPFATGPRMCPGMGFSMQLFQLVLPTIVRRMKLAFVPGTRIDRESNLTLGLRSKLPVQILPRDGVFSAVPLTGDIHEMVDLTHVRDQRAAS